MTYFKKHYINVGLILSCIIFTLTTHAQVKRSYHIFKLGNQIGTEEVTSIIDSENNSSNIIITARDRGYPQKLLANVKLKNEFFQIASHGQTSRFKEQKLDTTIATTNGFPLIENGSIKVKELLIAYWNKKGKPTTLKSTLNGSNITIQKLNNPNKLGSTGSDLTVLKINNGLDEIMWLDRNGNAVFLTTIDSEGDKREIISEEHLSNLNILNKQSSQFLIQSYIESSKDLSPIHPSIAIVGGNIIDIEHSGELRKNAMVLINHGNIDYVGVIDKSRIPSGAKVIDATNKFLLPGLWDMHAHLFHPYYLQKQLLSGVTTVRDMANDFDFIVDLKNMTNKSLIAAPEIYTAGLLDGKSATTLGKMLATNPKEIKTNIKRYHDAGFNQIKIYDNIRKQDFNTIVDVANSYKMDVVGHLPNGYTMNYFINNGINSISHIHYFMNNIKWSSEDLKAANQSFLNSMISKNIYLDPTLNVYQLNRDKRISNLGRLVKLFVDCGIPIVAGTDNEGTIPDEIHSYIQLGISPLDAIKAATIVPARVMGVSARKGSIDVGKDGDVLILNENPLENPSVLKNIKTIIKGQFIINL